MMSEVSLMLSLYQPRRRKGMQSLEIFQLM
jgi:hypothetical protein